MGTVLLPKVQRPPSRPPGREGAAAQQPLGTRWSTSRRQRLPEKHRGSFCFSVKGSPSVAAGWEALSRNPQRCRNPHQRRLKEGAGRGAAWPGTTCKKHTRGQTGSDRAAGTCTSTSPLASPFSRSPTACSGSA